MNDLAEYLGFKLKEVEDDVNEKKLYVICVKMKMIF